MQKKIMKKRSAIALWGVLFLTVCLAFCGACRRTGDSSEPPAETGSDTFSEETAESPEESVPGQSDGWWVGEMPAGGVFGRGGMQESLDTAYNMV